MAINSSAPASTGALPQVNANTGSFLESVLPGIGNLTTSATGVIGNLLNGLPSVSQARTNNAYFGVGAGQPDTSGVGSFTATRGADLYGQQAQASQQTGLGDLMQTIGTYTSPALANQGQQLSNQQFNSAQGQQASQFNQQNQIQQFLAQLQALGLGNQITGQLPGNIPLSL